MVEVEIASLKNECSINVGWASTKNIMQPGHYIERWRLVLWDKVFCVYFNDKGEFKFTKGLNIMGF